MSELTKLGQLIDAMDKTRRAEEEVIDELKALLDGAPQSSAELCDHAMELGRTQQEMYAHHSGKWPEKMMEHNHLACAKQTGTACPRCQAWNDLCRRHDAAVEKLGQYGQLLAAKSKPAPCKFSDEEGCDDPQTCKAYTPIARAS